MTKAVRRSPLKYDDKSPGQPAVSHLFESIKKIISPYARGNYIVKTEKPGAYEIYYNREIEQQGRKYPEICFVSLLVQKGYVGFYYFPIYIDLSLKQELQPELLKTLKGKTCFHIKKDDQELLDQISHAVRTGFNYYHSRGWK